LEGQSNQSDLDLARSDLGSPGNDSKVIENQSQTEVKGQNEVKDQGEVVPDFSQDENGVLDLTVKPKKPEPAASQPNFV